MRRAEGEVLPAVARRQGLARLSGARGRDGSRRQATRSASLAADPGLPSQRVVGRRARRRARRRGVVSRRRPGARALAIVGEPGIGKTTVWDEALGTRGIAARSCSSPGRRSRRRGSRSPGSPTSSRRFRPSALRSCRGRSARHSTSRSSESRRAVRRSGVWSAPRCSRCCAGSPPTRGRARNRRPPVARPAVRSRDRVRAPAADRRAGSGDRLPSLGCRRIHSTTSCGENGPRRLELGPLSVASLHRIVADSLGRTFRGRRSCGSRRRRAAIRCTRSRSRGSSPGAPGQSRRLPVPDSLRTLVASAFGALPARTRDALLRAAALGRPDLRLVDAQALAAAEEAGLVRIHARPRSSSHIRSMRRPSTRPRHAAGGGRPIARLPRKSRDPEERARHLALASEAPTSGSRGSRGGGARTQARRPRHRGRADGARARARPGGKHDANERRLELAEHLYLASDFERSGEVLQALRRELRAGDLRARASSGLRRSTTGGRASRRPSARGRGGAPASDPLVRGRCHAAIAMYAGTVDLPKAAAAARAALELLETMPEADPELLAYGARRTRSRRPLPGRVFDAEAAERARTRRDGRQPAGRRHANGLQARPVASLRR